MQKNRRWRSGEWAACGKLDGKTAGTAADTHGKWASGWAGSWLGGGFGYPLAVSLAAGCQDKSLLRRGAGNCQKGNSALYCNLPIEQYAARFPALAKFPPPALKQAGFLFSRPGWRRGVTRVESITNC